MMELQLGRRKQETNSGWMQVFLMERGASVISTTWAGGWINWPSAWHLQQNFGDGKQRNKYSVAGIKQDGVSATQIWGFLSKNTGMTCHFLLQGSFPTQGLNLRLRWLLNWQAGSLPLSYLGSPTQHKTEREWFQEIPHFWKRGITATALNVMEVVMCCLWTEEGLCKKTMSRNWRLQRGEREILFGKRGWKFGSCSQRRNMQRLSPLEYIFY